MATYFTFFLSRTEELPAAFPDWKKPLTQPVLCTKMNPFTGETMTISTRAPKWDDAAPDWMEAREPKVAQGMGDYPPYLESRLPPFVQAKSHWCTKDLTSLELEPLIEVATGIGKGQLEPALYSHPAVGSTLEEVPDDFVVRMAAPDVDLASIAENWSKAMSAPEFTHALGGDRVMEDWTAEDALALLMPIAALLQVRASGESLYVLTDFP